MFVHENQIMSNFVDKYLATNFRTTMMLGTNYGIQYIAKSSNNVL